VRLRPVSEDDLPVVEKLRQDPGAAGEFAWFGWNNLRGLRQGAEAHRLLVRYLFEHTTVHRIEAVTEVGNAAEQRALEKAGFAREGVMRGECWRGGEWRDTVIYSILRTDPFPGQRR
jgi:RimJ/RimL family protein N-acetyltransferase